MECLDAQERILDSPDVRAADVNDHLSFCASCRGFAEIQWTLDRQLSALVPRHELSPAFRVALARRIRQESVSSWPEFLPDVAHLAGCVCAIALLLVLRTYPAGQVTMIGVAFTLLTYFIQAVLRGTVESLEESSQ